MPRYDNAMCTVGHRPPPPPPSRSLSRAQLCCACLISVSFVMVFMFVGYADSASVGHHGVLLRRLAIAYRRTGQHASHVSLDALLLYFNARAEV